MLTSSEAGASRAGSGVPVWSLMAVGAKRRLKCSVQQPGRKCFVAGSAHTAGGGRFVMWCETSGSGFSSDDTHSPLCTSWQTLNNTQQTPGICGINILRPAAEQGCHRRRDTWFGMDWRTNWIWGFLFFFLQNVLSDSLLIQLHFSHTLFLLA